MAQLHETFYGRKFFDADFPAAVKALQQIAAQLSESNRLKRLELGLSEAMNAGETDDE